MTYKINSTIKHEIVTRDTQKVKTLNVTAANNNFSAQGKSDIISTSFSFAKCKKHEKLNISRAKIRNLLSEIFLNEKPDDLHFS